MDYYGRAVRLVLVTQDFPPERGGIQTWAVEMAQRLAVQCERFAVIAPAVAGAREIDQKLGFEVVRVGTPNTLIAASAAALTRLVLGGGFRRTLHAQWTTALPALALRATGRLEQVAVAAMGRELLLQPWKRFPFAQSGYDRIRRASLGRADRVLPISHYTGSLVQALGVEPARMRVIPLGTDPVRYHPEDGGGLRAELGLGQVPVLLTVSRLVPRKGIDTVLSALPLVLGEVPDAHYVVVGEGPDRARLTSLATERGISHKVHFVGGIDDADLCHWYAMGDVFVMPSRSEAPDVEGFGLVFLEAAACGVPSIAAHAGGIPDSVADGESGLLVPPDDSAALARAIVRLLSDPEYTRELGRRARARVLADFTWDHVARRTLDALES